MAKVAKSKERIPTVSMLVGLLGYEPAYVDRLTKSVAYQLINRAQSDKHELISTWKSLEKEYVGKKLMYNNLNKGIKEYGVVVAVRPRVMTDTIPDGVPLSILLHNSKKMTTGSSSKSLEWL